MLEDLITRVVGISGYHPAGDHAALGADSCHARSCGASPEYAARGLRVDRRGLRCAVHVRRNHAMTISDGPMI